MLRELYIDEMSLVSGGGDMKEDKMPEDEVVTTGVRIRNNDGGSGFGIWTFTGGSGGLLGDGSFGGGGLVGPPEAGGDNITSFPITDYDNGESEPDPTPAPNALPQPNLPGPGGFNVGNIGGVDVFLDPQGGFPPNGITVGGRIKF